MICAVRSQTISKYWNPMNWFGKKNALLGLTSIPPFLKIYAYHFTTSYLYYICRNAYNQSNYLIR
jgi:hypothetical protein